MDATQHTLAVLAGILVLGIGAQWLAWRIKVPAILLLLVVGTIAGSGTGFIKPDEVFGNLLLPLVSLSVGLILFEGGLNLRFAELRETWRSLLGLLTVGVIVTWAGATLAGVYLLELRFPIAFVLGAVLTVTGPTVIGPLLREIRPTGKVGAIAKWEGIAIDPVGATLSLLAFETIESIREADFASATIAALTASGTVCVIGVAIGLATAGLLVLMIKRYWIPDYLCNPMALMFVVAAFATAELLHHEAGLLAATVMGIALANQRQIDVRGIVDFKESLAVLLIAMLFILLSARVPFESLVTLGWRGPAFALFLIFVVRPLAVGMSTLGSGLSIAERCFLSWLAPRGIVAAALSSVLALRLGDSGNAIAPATFTVIFFTVTIYGLTAGWLARRLGLSVPNAQGLLIAGANQISRAIAAALANEGFYVMLVDTRYSRSRKSREVGLNVCFANILSEHVADEVDFAGLGQFLALTSNDEVNSLAVAHFREVFGGDKVFHLAPEETKHSRLEVGWQHRLTGRRLFSPELTYTFLHDALDNGAVIKVTRLTETFNYEAFQTHYHSRAWPLFLIDGKRLEVVTADAKLVPSPGGSIVSLVFTEPDVAEAGKPLVAPIEFNDPVVSTEKIQTQN